MKLLIPAGARRFLARSLAPLSALLLVAAALALPMVALPLVALPMVAGPVRAGLAPGSARGQEWPLVWQATWPNSAGKRNSARLGAELGAHRICGKAGIAYLRHDTGRSQLRYLDLATGRSTILTRGQFAQPLACSPDGRFILHAQVAGCPNRDSCNHDAEGLRTEMRLIDRASGVAEPVGGQVVSAAWDTSGRFALFEDIACHDPSEPPADFPSNPRFEWIRHCPRDRNGGEWRPAGEREWAIFREGRAVVALRWSGFAISETAAQATPGSDAACWGTVCVEQVAAR